MPQNGDPKPEVRLPQGGGAYVHPGVPAGAVDHAAAFEAARRARQAQHGLPKTRAPVAGGPAPAIPDLRGAPQHTGLTMAQHAMAERAPLAQQGPQGPGDGFVEPAVTLSPNQVPASPGSLGILPTDELPAQAREDPAFIRGTGEMFAANQPALALKYGVVRGGRLVPPQAIRGQQQRQLRPETLRDLEELQALEKRQVAQAVPPTAESTEMGRAAGEVGIPPAPKALSEEDKKEIQDTLKNLDEFDFDRWRQSLMKDILNNEQQKKLIESRLKPMDVGDLITQGYIIQKVEIIPGRFWVEFKTLDGETDLALKRMIMEDSRSVEVSDRYYLDKFGLMSVTAVIHRINDRAFGDTVDERGNFDDEKFRAKFTRVVRLPMPMLASIGANALWFDVRVRKLFVAEEVGNG